MVPSTQRRSRRFGHVVLGLVAVVALASCDVGWVNPYAGDGTAGTTTGTVPEAQARFTAPTGIVAIPGGGFYVYDAATCAIYKNSQHQISVYAGTPGTCGNTGDGGPATAATLDNSPTGDSVARTSSHGPGKDSSTPMTLGPDGSLYFVEVTIVSWSTAPPDMVWPVIQSQVRRIAPDGTISAVGNGIAGSVISFITGVTTTPDGTVLVTSSEVGADSTEIASIAPNGSQTTVTTTPGLVYAIAAISNTQVATLNYSFANSSASVDRVDLTTGEATPTGQAASLMDDVLAASPDGTIYFGSSTANTIVRIAPDNTVSPLAGNGTADPGTGAQRGNGLSLNLTPTGVALTPNHGLLISSGHVVYRLEDPAHAGTLELGSPLNYFGGDAHCSPPHGPTSPTPSSPPTTYC